MPPTFLRRFHPAIALAAGAAIVVPALHAASAVVDCGDLGGSPPALAKINAVRAAGRGCPAAGIAPAPAAPALRWDDRLTEVASRQVGAMAAQQRLSHQGSAGEPLGSRVASSGYPMRQAVENVAAGFATLDAVLEVWRGSEEHCANLLNAAVRELGLACVERAGVHYWSLVLGRSALADGRTGLD